MQLLRPLVMIFAIRLDQSGGEPASLSLVPRSQSSKAKVFDFLSCLQAWNNFVGAFVFYHPYTMSQLLYYQAMVCDYFNQYTFNDVYAYDRNFRQRMAALPDLRWDRHDQELVANFFYVPTNLCVLGVGILVMWLLLVPCSPLVRMRVFPGLLRSSLPKGFHSLFPEADHFPTQDHTAHQARSFLDRTIGTLIPMGSATIIDASQCIGAAHAVVHTQNSSHADNSLSRSHVTGFQPIPSTFLTPIDVSKLSYFLRSYQNIALARYLIDGFTNGFDIGYRGPSTPGTQKN